MKRKVILASQSPQRKALMKTLDIPFKVIPAEINERAVKAKNLKLRAEKIARAKAEAVLADHPGSIIIAADTYTVFAGKAMEKPRDNKEARKMLTFQSGKPGVTYSGFCYLDEKNKINFSTTVETKLIFSKLSATEIDRYVENQPVTTWAAAYSGAYIEGLVLIDSINGSLTSFTHGLPMELVIKKLRQSGVYD